MGDRANIAIKQNSRRGEPSRIYFYTHWSGHELPIILQDALSRGQGRWNDEPYLARIIFSEMIKGEVLDETGYGISTYIIDGDGYPLLVVDAETQTVSLEGGDVIGAPLTFSEFVHTHLSQRDPWSSLTAAVNAKADAATSE